MREWSVHALFAFALVQTLFALPAAAALTGQVRIHDPARILKQGPRYYTFGTGFSVNGNSAPIISKYSSNMTHWLDGPAVFTSIPAWAQAEVPNNPGFMWAPDVFYHNGEYRMYYSVSSFGSQNSVIGLATNKTLDFASPNYAWVDQGMVVESETGNSFNAIDAGIFHDETTNRMWMTFGSFWNGIHITELDPGTGKRLSSRAPITNIARNPVNPPNAIEAPFLTKHENFYYLFVNWDTCCQGSSSTYKIRVGRGTSPAGPFVDRGGTAMLAGGGELFLATEGSMIGPGHFSEYSEGGTNYFSYHYYDGNDQGRSKLAIDKFAWTFDGWPALISDLPTGDYNQNGIVDAADYTVWHDTLGSTTDLRANGDNTGASAGLVDAADYLVWQNHLGEVYPAGSGAFEVPVASVPEPNSLGLIALAVVALMSSRSKFQNKRRRLTA